MEAPSYQLCKEHNLERVSMSNFCFNQMRENKLLEELVQNLRGGLSQTANVRRSKSFWEHLISFSVNSFPSTSLVDVTERDTKNLLKFDVVVINTLLT